MKQIDQRRALIPSISLFVVGLALAGCQAHSPLNAYSSIPPQVQQRHPIMLTSSKQTAMVDVSRQSAKLSGMQRADVEGFVRAFRADGTTSLVISLPAGSPNEVNAVHLSREIRQVAGELGVPANSISVKPYSVHAKIPSPPIVLSYTRLRAGVPHNCGVVSSMDIGQENLSYEDHGCSTQNNLAAMLSNPNDIHTPRPMDKADSGRRYNVIDKYRQAQVTSSEVRSASAGTVSQVGK